MTPTELITMALIRATNPFHDAEGTQELIKKALATLEGCVVVPREPTRELWAAMGNAVVHMDGVKIHHDIVTEAVYSAIIKAAEGKQNDEQ